MMYCLMNPGDPDLYWHSVPGRWLPNHDMATEYNLPTVRRLRSRIRIDGLEIVESLPQKSDRPERSNR